MSENSVVVITGANRGIGLELARLYAGRGCSVIGVCREASPELEEVAKRIIESVDVTTDAGVAKLVAGRPHRTFMKDQVYDKLSTKPPGLEFLVIGRLCASWTLAKETSKEAAASPAARAG